jgi:hypothetical protein
MNHYLVLRFPAEDTSLVRTHADSEMALKEYEDFERLGYDCCLFGTDSLATLRQTHGNWLLGNVVETVPA